MPTHEVNCNLKRNLLCFLCFKKWLSMVRLILLMEVGFISFSNCRIILGLNAKGDFGWPNSLIKSRSYHGAGVTYSTCLNHM